MPAIKLSAPPGPVRCELDISGSKSISNRALIIRALCDQPFRIHNLSTSDDTRILEEILDRKHIDTADAHHAGTSFRFLCAYLALREGSQVLTGSDRMKERPVGELVEALREIGADIEYLGIAGYPPLRINSFRGQRSRKLGIRADVSSQFLSALCLVAPGLPQGLALHLEGELVSRPYLDMTLELMRRFGIPATFEENIITVAPGKYQAREFTVESDWSSASYHYGICSLLPGSRIGLRYYFRDSLQGDSAITEIAESFGVHTRFASDGIVLEEKGRSLTSFEYDFIRQPDLFQTVAVLSAACGIPLKARGLKTLAIKETDRVHALAAELEKVGISVRPAEDSAWEVMVDGDVAVRENIFDTYHDHRMAMSLALLACISPVIIRDPDVVSKSYPGYWKDLEKMGFRIQKTEK